MTVEGGNLKIAALAFLFAAGGCGLLEPPAPPGRLLGGAPGLPGVAKPDGGAGVGVAPFPGYALAWSDDFQGAALDETAWTIDVGRWRDAFNSRDSIVLRDGILQLVTFTAPDGVHHAPHIHTGPMREFTYGYFEARVRFLESEGEWCSFFLWPDTIGNPKGDPGTAGVEIDIFEHRHFDNSGWDVRDVIQVGINWDGFDRDWKKDHQVLAHPLGEPLAYAWHTYAALWTPEGTTFYIDEIPVWRTSAAVSHRSQDLYLTCEVRHGSWAGYIPEGGYGSLAQSTTRMEVDWVRVWQATN